VRSVNAACRVMAIGAAVLSALLLNAAVFAQDAKKAPEAKAQATKPQETKQSKISFSELQQAAQKLRDEERKAAQEREKAARAELQKQEGLAKEAVAVRSAQESRSTALDQQWTQNEARIEEISAQLKQSQGNLGELFGVTRQVAGDSATVLQQSLLTAQYGQPEKGEDRAEFMRRMADARALPSISELKRLWYELTREMADGGKVQKFTAPVLQQDGSKVDMEIVRVGPFTATSNGQFLGYLSSDKSLAVLDGTLPRKLEGISSDLQDAVPDDGYTQAVVDPARGALLGLYIQRPGFVERVREGEVIGIIIIIVGVLGMLLAIYQALYLVATKAAVTEQLKNLDNPKNSNPLGRLLLAYRGDGKRIETAELAELRMSEAVLREVPRLERFQGFLRLAVAAGPLLGLIGTVVGMIITFRAIVASGSSDPRLMADGIGQAMIATVLGLGIAIPLLFMNTGLATLSKRITQALDEQANALLAASSEERKVAG